jgi:hypothetical protein
LVRILGERAQNLDRSGRARAGASVGPARSSNREINERELKMSDDTAEKPKDYEVGYGKPPKEHRFKPGRSGNPKGRPKGSRNIKDIFKEELNSRVIVTENGRTRSMTKAAVAIRRLIDKALHGDHKSIATVLALDARWSDYAAETLSPEELGEFDAMLLEQGLKRLQSKKGADTPSGEDQT